MSKLCLADLVKSALNASKLVEEKANELSKELDNSKVAIETLTEDNSDIQNATFDLAGNTSDIQDAIFELAEQIAVLTDKFEELSELVSNK